MTEFTPVLLLISGGISLAIMYWIIQSAVASATKKMHAQLQIQNRLLLEQLRQQGTSEERLRDLLDLSKRITLAEKEPA